MTSFLYHYMPIWMHERILDFTGWRIVYVLEETDFNRMLHSDSSIWKRGRYFWTNRWPL